MLALPGGNQALGKAVPGCGAGTCGKAARGRNFLYEVKPGLSNSSLGPCPAVAGRAGIGPWDSPILAESGALPAEAFGPQTLPQDVGQHPGDATVHLDKSYLLSETQFPPEHFIGHCASLVGLL